MRPLREISAPDDVQETFFGIVVETAGLKSKLYAGLPTNEAI